MSRVIDDNSVEVLECPIDISLGDWAIEHPECDAIYEPIGNGPMIRIFAFARSHDGNAELKKTRAMKFETKRILKGMTYDGISGII